MFLRFAKFVRFTSSNKKVPPKKKESAGVRCYLAMTRATFRYSRVLDSGQSISHQLAGIIPTPEVLLLANTTPEKGNGVS